MKTTLIIAGLCVAVYVIYKTYSIRMVQKDLDQIIKKGPVILDVRTETEFKTGHIDGAINIPLSQLHHDSIPLDKTLSYVTCCSHGLRSIKAVSLLKEHGYKQVYNGGAWSDLEKTINDTPVTSRERSQAKRD